MGRGAGVKEPESILFGSHRRWVGADIDELIERLREGVAGDEAFCGLWRQHYGQRLYSEKREEIEASPPAGRSLRGPRRGDARSGGLQHSRLSAWAALSQPADRLSYEVEDLLALGWHRSDPKLRSAVEKLIEQGKQVRSVS